MKTLNKPFLRGHFHQAAFFVALGACAMLVAQSHTSRDVIASSIYSLSIMAMFGISALYHRPNWNERGRVWMKRLDHAAIYLSIAGTGTPVAWLALPPAIGSQMLTVIWLACGIGILKCLFWVHSPKWLGASLYLCVGWIYAYFLPDLARALASWQVALLLGGGLVYTLGALVYAFQRPNPSPRVFGYHEIFHAMVIVAAALHFIVIKALVV